MTSSSLEFFGSITYSDEHNKVVAYNEGKIVRIELYEHDKRTHQCNLDDIAYKDVIQRLPSLGQVIRCANENKTLLEEALKNLYSSPSTICIDGSLQKEKRSILHEKVIAINETTWIVVQNEEHTSDHGSGGQKHLIGSTTRIQCYRIFIENKVRKLDVTTLMSLSERTVKNLTSNFALACDLATIYAGGMAQTAESASMKKTVTDASTAMHRLMAGITV